LSRELHPCGVQAQYLKEFQEMSMTDPIADMLTRIRNAAHARHRRVDVPASKMKTAIAKILADEGYVQAVRSVEVLPQGKIRIFLKYDENEGSVIQGIERISKPGRRVYVSRDNLPRVMGGYGISILSTSQGLMTGLNARQKGIGGEVVCQVW
jgi:small subunit ribosomal protein S8